MDPLSIATGVLGLLGTCIKVGSTLKAFYDGASFADTKVKGLLTDVESFTQVLHSIKTTSHISARWVFLATSIQDGQTTLLQLQETLERVNKSVTLKESTDKVLPNLDEINQAIRRIALDLSDRMRSFQQGKAADPNDSQLLALKNLSNCVQSAATVVSSASTILGVEDDDQFSIINGSEFGDIFVSEPGETMRRWISSKTVSEFEEDRGGESSSKRRNATSNYLQQVDENTESDQSDSDTDLELEIVQALLKRGKERLEAKDLEASERLFRNCLSRLSSNVSTLSLHHIPKQKSEIIILLLDVYVAQEKWDDAQSLLLEKIAAGSRDNSGNNGTLLLDMLILVDVLIHKESYTEALLYGRRALRGYRKLGSNGLEGVESSLKSLMRVCHLNGNYDEEGAYAAILSDFLRRNVPYQKSLDTTQPNAHLTQPPPTSSSATTLVLGRDHSMSSLWPPGPKALATDSTAITASKEKFSSYPLIASEVAEQDTQTNVSSSAIVDFVIKAPPKPIEVHNKPLLTQNTIATSRGIPSPIVTPAEVQSALDPESRRISGGKMTTIDSNEQRAEGPVVHGTRDNSSVSSTSQPALMFLDTPKLTRNLVIVGNGAFCKTSLLLAFTTGSVWENLGPTTFPRNYVHDVEVDAKHVDLHLRDTSGWEDYDRIRPLSYPDSNVVLICFAVDSPDSLDDVQWKWINEVAYYCSRVPIILVGLKKDLRDDSKTIEELHKISQKPITYEQGAQVAEKIGAYKYLECSVLTNEGVAEVLEYAARAALLPRKKGFLKRQRKKGEGSTGSFRRLFSRTSS
ncbi:hypothetical protein V8E51_000110 [Hyaloscypha variabilis]